MRTVGDWQAGDYGDGYGNQVLLYHRDSKTELKPCPFCGSERTYRNSIIMETGKRFFIVYCLDCGISTRAFLDVRDAENHGTGGTLNDTRQLV